MTLGDPPPKRQPLELPAVIAARHRDRLGHTDIWRKSRRHPEGLQYANPVGTELDTGTIFREACPPLEYTGTDATARQCQT